MNTNSQTIHLLKRPRVRHHGRDFSIRVGDRAPLLAQLEQPLRGGQATTIATINCFSLITSGLWGLLWYRELKGRPAVAWAVAAAFTAAMSVLLSMEKG